MKLIDAFYMGADTLSDYGLVDDGWTFGFDNAYKRFGVTKFATKRITISTALTKVNDETAVKNVILHEIAHVLAGPKENHTKKWREIALMIGCDGEQYAKGVNTKPKRWRGTCPMGHNAYRERLSARHNYSCNTCAPGRFDRNSILTWERNDAS